MPRYIGLDLHKHYIHGCEWRPDAPEQKQERHFRIPNTPAGWQALCAQLDRTCWIALEVTGSAFEAHDRLSPHAARVLLANAHALKRLGSGRHTDRVDATRLAQMLALGTLPPVWVPPPALRDVRRLLQNRERLTSTRRRYINQAKAVLARYGVLLPVRADVTRAAARADLAAVPPADRAILASTLRQLTLLSEEIHTVETEIASRAAATPAVPLLLTITNVGLIAAAALWAILGDPHRFAHPKQLTRYVGLDPSIFQSGEQHRRGRISKNGSSLLRTVLVEAALGLARHDTGSLGQFYARKRAQIGHKKALIALARKLLIVAWRMLLTGELYRAAKPRSVARKHRMLQRRASQPLPPFEPPHTAPVHPGTPLTHQTPVPA